MRVFVGLGIIGLIVATTVPANASCTARKNVSGEWKGSDQAKYSISIHGNEVWWIGDGGTFTNVFKGVMNGNMIDGDWADVLRTSGPNFGRGKLRTEVVRTAGGGVAFLRKVSGTGSGFGADKWTYGC